MAKLSISKKIDKLNNSKAIDDKNKFLEIIYFVHRNYPYIIKDYSHVFQYNLKFKTGVP